MNVGSLFSGVGGLDHGLDRAGLRHVFFCEKDPWRREVLAARWPGVPIYEDVRVVGEPAPRAAADERRADPVAGGREAGAGLLGGGDVELLCGGFPCQDLSVAGRRRGLAGERSGLFHEFARVIDAFRPGWVLVENVPGLLSSNSGRDFGIVVGTLADLGYGVAWRVLDSRFFGVPQRRRRVFIVGAVAVGDPRAAADRAGQVLAVGTRCPGHPPTGTETRPDSADPSSVGFTLRRDPGGVGQGHNTNYVASLSGLGDGGPDDNDGQANRVIATALVSRYGKGTDSDATDAMVSFDAEYSNQASLGDDKAVLTRKLRRAVSSAATGVRRLTPVECERLQGLPDDWTKIDSKTPDSRRYSALGDAVTANVAEWIGCRLLAAGDGQP